MVALVSQGRAAGLHLLQCYGKEFHDRNPGYNCDQETEVQEKLWADFLMNIMIDEEICGRKIYVALARSQRRG